MGKSGRWENGYEDLVKTGSFRFEVTKLTRRLSEHCLHEPQADEALADARQFRHTIQGLWQFKKLNISGTGNKLNTLMLDLYNRIDYKLQRAANRYRITYAALMALDPNSSW